MAPPSHRRPGYSRKAQYSLFAAYVIAIAGAIFAALVLLISVADPRGFAMLRSEQAILPESVLSGLIRLMFVAMSCVAMSINGYIAWWLAQRNEAQHVETHR